MIDSRQVLFFIFGKGNATTAGSLAGYGDADVSGVRKLWQLDK